MASSWAEFCEQTNPGVLSEARGARLFQNARRVQESISAAAEKRAGEKGFGVDGGAYPGMD